MGTNHHIFWLRPATKKFFSSNRSGAWGPHLTSFYQDAYIRTSESLSAIVADYALDDDKLPGI